MQNNIPIKLLHLTIFNTRNDKKNNTRENITLSVVYLLDIHFAYSFAPLSLSHTAN